MSLVGYPPSRHLLSDLGMEASITSGTTARVRTRVTPEVTTADHRVRTGVLATLVDVVGGAIAMRALYPDRMATADLAIELVGPPVGSSVEARGTVLRRGRTTLVVEALVVPVDDEGRDVSTGDAGTEPVAWASMTFAVLPGGAGPDGAIELPSRWAFTGGHLDRPVLESLPVTVVDAAAGRVSVPVRPYLHNSFGAVQGGVVALVAESAGAEALGAACGRSGGDMVVTGLQIAYLALGRVGPVTSSARVLTSGPDGRGGAVVELRDAGADGRLMTVVNVTAEPAGLPAAAPS